MMQQTFYMNNRTAIINFSAAYYNDAEQLLSSEGFSEFLSRYLKDLAVRDISLFTWITHGRELDAMIKDMVRLTKQLMIMDVGDILDPLVDQLNRMRALFVVEDAYNYWREKQRFSIINPSTSTSLAFNSFIDADTRYNQMIIQIYRTCERKLQGRSNNVYRQLQAGTNASMVMLNYRWPIPAGYQALKGIPFINTIMLRTPLMLHPLSNKREGFFTARTTNPVKDASLSQQEWFCYPAKVGGLLCYLFFHRDYMASVCALANLFELAADSECIKHKPDLICLFGNPDDKNECTYFYDQENDIWVGSVSYRPQIEYFGYLKKMMLTLHNLARMQKGWLPIHGSMVDIYLKNGRHKNVIMIGDSGAGKSETIEALRKISADTFGPGQITRMDIVFDDMGSLHRIGSRVVAQGTETGAFIRLDDLDKKSTFRDMERTVFMNPESAVNARLVVPVSSYQLITDDHPVDMVLYANNYDHATGLMRFETFEQAREVFISGRRMAKGTTQEVGMTQTYFANPFGPMQQQQQCDAIFDDIFKTLFANDVYVGQIYTNLGLADKSGLLESAGQLYQAIKGDDEK